MISIVSFKKNFFHSTHFFSSFTINITTNSWMVVGDGSDGSQKHPSMVLFLSILPSSNRLVHSFPSFLTPFFPSNHHQKQKRFSAFLLLIYQVTSDYCVSKCGATNWKVPEEGKRFLFRRGIPNSYSSSTSSSTLSIFFLLFYLSLFFSWLQLFSTSSFHLISGRNCNYCLHR